MARHATATKVHEHANAISSPSRDDFAAMLEASFETQSPQEGAVITGTVVAEALSAAAGSKSLRLGMPSGVLTVDADVVSEGGAWFARAGSFYRTARRLFDGRVWVP